MCGLLSCNTHLLCILSLHTDSIPIISNLLLFYADKFSSVPDPGPKLTQTYSYPNKTKSILVNRWDRTHLSVLLGLISIRNVFSYKEQETQLIAGFKNWFSLCNKKSRGLVQWFSDVRAGSSVIVLTFSLWTPSGCFSSSLHWRRKTRFSLSPPPTPPLPLTLSHL